MARELYGGAALSFSHRQARSSLRGVALERTTLRLEQATISGKGCIS
jgi:hypothetical protein